MPSELQHGRPSDLPHRAFQVVMHVVSGVLLPEDEEDLERQL